MNVHDAQTDNLNRRVIVVERRSLFGQTIGIWLVALPLLIALWICTTPRIIDEPDVATLNLPPTDWINGPKPKISLESKPAEKAEKTAPLITKTIIAETPAPKPLPAEPKQAEPTLVELPQGVIVMQKPGMSANPVIEFDPKQKAAGSETEPRKPPVEAAPNAAQATPNIPPEVETKQVLAEIQAAAEQEKSKRERDETLMPLLVAHEKAQAEKRKADTLERLKARAESGRVPFFEGLAEIVNGDGNTIEKGQNIDLYMRRESEGFSSALYQPVFVKLETAKRPPSTATRIDYLRSRGVPEPIILAYLIQLDMRSVRKPEGPRDTNDAIVRSAKMLLRNRD